MTKVILPRSLRLQLRIETRTVSGRGSLVIFPSSKKHELSFIRDLEDIGFKVDVSVRKGVTD